jgi:hypothetical protein
LLILQFAELGDSLGLGQFGHLRALRAYQGLEIVIAAEQRAIRL